MLFVRYLATASMVAAATIPRILQPWQNATGHERAPESLPAHLEIRQISYYNDQPPHQKREDNKTEPSKNESSIQTPKPLMRMEFHFSKKMVIVGNLDVQQAIRGAGYRDSDMTGLSTDTAYEQYGGTIRCMPQTGRGHEKPDVKVNIKAKGAWGKIGDADEWTVRNQLIDAFWQLAAQVVDRYDTLYEGCTSCTGRAVTCNTESAICGNWRKGPCPCSKLRKSNPYYNAYCYAKKDLWKVPSEMTMRIYNSDGILRADHIDISVTSEIIDPEVLAADTCGKMGAVAEVGVSFIPLIGSYLDKVVKVVCREHAGF